jgi:hypothetical protein
MANPIWRTAGGNLGTVPEDYYFEIQLEAYDPNGGPVTFKFLSGQFPPGMYVTKTGSVQGVPIVTSGSTNLVRAYQFSIRATDQNGLVSDNTFEIAVSNIIPPQITPRISSLGDVFDGSYYNLQLESTEVNPSATLTWKITSGALPAGLSLSSTGLISGFTIPLPQLGNAGQVGFASSPYNEYGYENAAQYQNSVYEFTVEVFDGINYDSLSYSINIIAKDHFEADTTLDTVDTSLTVDSDNRYLPIMTTPSQALPEVRSNSKFAFLFEAIDPNNEALQFGLANGSASGFDQGGDTGYDTTGFDQQNLSLPPGLTLDVNTGWLTGTLGSQAAATLTYTFNIFAFEASDPSNASKPVQYTMTVLGDINNTVTWITGADLGSIDNGSISELSVSAVNNAGKPVVYSLVTDQTHLPQGLELLNSGLIVGRCSFDYFSLDNESTTIDGGATTFDNTYSFTILASSTDNTSTATRTFTVTINNINKIPYENLYLKALPTLDQRQTFLNIVNNKEIFPDELIYRSGDPWFGRAVDIRSLFLAGLNPDQVSTFANAMLSNTYNKRIEFSNVKTAQALDANFNVKYEVVYLELVDTETYNGNSPANVGYDAVISADVYPNAFNNMSSVITSAVGYANQGALPDWMTSPQANKKQLGFTRAIVLAYTVPGASNLIAYRLNANGIVFNNIDFVADRYDLDNFLTTNYNANTGLFNSGTETTFDRIKRPGTVPLYADYANSTLAFDMINGKTVAQIQALGGFDGITDFNNGDTLIFARQENYPGETNANDGWNLNGQVIPGFLEHQLNPSIPNQRSSIWQINISSGNVVTLSVSSSIIAGEYIQINFGNTGNSSIWYYDPVLKPGQSVPAFTRIPTLLNNPTTRFDNYGTRFINNRDVYETPESGDRYLKFPKVGVFQ